MKVIVIGSTGQLGQSLKSVLKEDLDAYIFLDRSKLNLTQVDQIKSIEKYNPSCIVNASAYTDVDLAENEKELAFAINQQAVQEIARVAYKLDIPLIHISTDYVFDGTSEIAYKEHDKTNPLGVYGKSKLQGEQEIIQKLKKYIIIRTAWVFSEYRNNFLKTMCKLQKKSEISIINDQFGCPTYAKDLAKSIVNIIGTLNQYQGRKQPFLNWGTFHYCGDEQVTWYSFAKEIFKVLQMKNVYRTIPKIKTISTREYKTTATRPKFSILDCSKINKVFNIRPSIWKKGIELSINEIYKGFSE